MTDQPETEQEAREREADVLERDQEHKGYGEDEGERDASLPEGEQE
ncbi:MAG: hypothetical protein ABUS54_05820 [Actinomycetota bacterium]